MIEISYFVDKYSLVYGESGEVEETEGGKIMEIYKLDSWKKEYTVLKIVRLQPMTEVKCLRCKNEIPGGSIALLTEGNFICMGCHNGRSGNDPQGEMRERKIS